MLLNRYPVVLLDADGTLFDFVKAETFALRRSFADLGQRFRMSYLPVYQEINDVLWKQLERGEVNQDFVRTERFERFCARIDLQVDAPRLASAYIAYLSTAHFLLRGASRAVRALSRGSKLAVITNGLKDVQHGRFGRSPVTRFFADIVISDEVGVQKPDPRIFDIALERLGNPDRTGVLMVGDSLTSDIAGGINAKIDTCWLNPSNRPASGVRPTYVIRRLAELPGIVRGA